jgi:hypothetical protein
MQSLYITIERDRESRSSADGARFRVRVHTQPGAPALLVSSRLCQSVTNAKREAETLFGELAWKDEVQTPDNLGMRASAFLEFD